MMCNNRLTVLGSKAQVQQFQKSHWDRHLGARHCELLENSNRRVACRFETKALPLQSLRRLSRRWPGLTLLIDYEVEESRIKGLAKAKAGQLEHCEISY
jgi:hypothetical protein